MKPHLLVGYTNRRNTDFQFVAPVFKYENEYFLSTPDKNGLFIESFIPFDPLRPWCNYEEHDEKFYLKSPVLYIFLYKGKLFYGTKAQMFVDLFQILRNENLHQLTKYDIHYFFGDNTAVDAVLKEFINTYPTQGLKINTFLKPSTIKLSLEEFSDCLNAYGHLLNYRNSAIPCTGLFSRIKDEIAFYNYRIKIENLENQFDFLIDRHSLLEYKDLIVHCYLQNKLSNRNIKNNSKYKLRKLIPIFPLDKLEKTFQDEELIRNTQSILRMESNALALSSHVTKNIEKRKSSNSQHVPEKLEKEIYQLREKIKEY